MTLGTDELLMDLVSSERIAALTYLSDDSGISHISERSGAVEHKIRGTSAEAILALHPDLILIGGWWKLEFLSTFRDMGIPVYVYRTPYTVEDVEKMIVEVAGAVGEEERGQSLREEYHRRIEKVQHRAEREKQRSALAIAGAGGTAYGTKGALCMMICAATPVSITFCGTSRSTAIQGFPRRLLLRKIPMSFLSRLGQRRAWRTCRAGRNF